MKKLTRQDMLELTRKKILSAASELFMAKGYSQTSTRDIAKKVGITQPALYHHFKNKVDIYEEVIVDLTKDVKLDLESILEKNLCLEEKLFEICKIFVIKHPTSLFSMINDIRREMTGEKSLKMYLIWKATYLDPVIAFLTQAQEEKQIRKGLDIEQSSRYLLTAISSTIEVQSMYKDIHELEEDIKSVVDFALYGIFQ